MKYLIGLFFVFTLQPLFGQEQVDLSKHQVSVDLGSYRNRYIYPISHLRYSSPLLKKVNLKFSGRIRSYGTLFLFSKSAYDFTPLVEYYFISKNQNLGFSAGAGIDARIRLVKDERSEAVSSAEPLLSFAMRGRYNKFSFSAPVWTRFYTNGISFSVLPEASYSIGKHCSLFVRYELSYLNVYRGLTREWRQDSFIGACVLF
jgi:hypothetical protein